MEMCLFCYFVRFVKTPKPENNWVGKGLQTHFSFTCIRPDWLSSITGQVISQRKLNKSKCDNLSTNKLDVSPMRPYHCGFLLAGKNKNNYIFIREKCVLWGPNRQLNTITERERDSLSEFMCRLCQSCIVINNSVSPLIPEHTSGGSANTCACVFCPLKPPLEKCHINISQACLCFSALWCMYTVSLNIWGLLPN